MVSNQKRIHRETNDDSQQSLHDHALVMRLYYLFFILFCKVLPCLLSSVGTGCIPSSIVFLIGSIRVKAVPNNCLAVGTPDP